MTADAEADTGKRIAYANLRTKHVSRGSIMAFASISIPEVPVILGKVRLTAE